MRFLVPLLLLTLGACSFSRMISGESIEYNSALEEHDNAELVVNILRAKENVPLSFSDLSQIHGSISTQGTLMSTWPFGPLRASTTRGSEQANLSFTLNPTFQVSPLNATIFSNAIQQPIDPKVIAQLHDTGYVPARVLLNLFIDSIEETINENTTVYPNTPCSGEYLAIACANQLRAFTQKLISMTQQVDANVAKTIVFHRYKLLSSVGPPATIVPFKELPAGAIVEKVNGSNNYQVYQVQDRVAVCLETRKYLLGVSVIVGPKVGLDSSDAACNAATIHKGDKEAAARYKFKFRSIRSLFDYLGHLLYVPVEQRPIYFDITPKIPKDPWISANYRKEDFYVALHESIASDTPQILQILTQLLNASRNASEIATTKSTEILP